jgi:hypothetical protein
MGSLLKWQLLKNTSNPIIQAAVGDSLSLWLDSSDPNTITESLGATSQWNDKSGKENHATQGTGSAQPTTNATTQNGLNILDFDNNDTLILPSALYGIPNGNNSIFVVGSHTSGNNDNYISMTEGGGGRYFVRADSDGDAMLGLNRSSDANAVSAATTTVAFHITTFIRSGIIQAIQVDNGTADINFSGQNESGIDAAHIGSKAGTGFFLAGGIGEIVLYNRALSAPETANINQFLSRKWGIPI